MEIVPKGPRTMRPRLGSLLVLAAAFMAFPALAQDEGSAPVESGGGIFDGMAFSGFVRFDAAFRTSDDENPNNLRGNPFNGVFQPRQSGLPVGGGALNVPGLPLGTTIGTLLDAAGIEALPAFRDSAARNTPKSDNNWALQQFRGKFDLTWQLTQNIQLYSSIRTIYDLGNYDNYDPDDVPNVGPIPVDPMGFNEQEPEFFEYGNYSDGGCLGYLEVCGQRYMADFTALYLDYQVGQFLFRFGQQQIAWGQALFFRVFDVPNGLDLRRHLILDDALEEYADERVAAPGLRVTWQATDQWEIDSYIQMFQQTTFPNPNTPYNVIPAQFTVHETFDNDHKGEDFNYGLRARANFGQWGLQFIATQRWNQEGTFKWTKSKVYQDVPGIIGSGLIVGETPLEVDPTGVWSAQEWFTYAGAVRLSGLEGLNDLINDFPAAKLLGASPVEDKESAANELDLFFTLAGGKLLGQTGGGLRGHIVREYHKEEVYGAGISYVVEGEPGTLLDQLIINLETSYIPDRLFTDAGLGQKLIKSDESVTALVMEKYHRWFEEFPATYMVFQAIHKTESDLFGRHLGCQGGTGGNPGAAAAAVNPDTKVCKPLDGGFQSVVLAALQPFPNYIYRLLGATLIDPRGGILTQVGFRWSPGNNMTFDFIYNDLAGAVWGDKNENIIETIDWADEFAIRAAYQF